MQFEDTNPSLKNWYVSQFWSIPKVSGIGAPEGLAAAEMALMNLAGWAVSCGQRNKPEMQGDGRKVKLGGNTAAVLNPWQGCGSAAAAVKMQKCCLMVGSTFSW